MVYKEAAAWKDKGHPVKAHPHFCGGSGYTVYNTAKADGGVCVGSETTTTVRAGPPPLIRRKETKTNAAQCVPLNKKDAKVLEILSENTYTSLPGLGHVKRLTQTIENSENQTILVPDEQQQGILIIYDTFFKYHEPHELVTSGSCQ